jgi:hypothetical protein
LETSGDAPFVASETTENQPDSTESSIIVIELSQFKIYLPYSRRSSQNQGISNTAPTSPVYTAEHETSAEIAAAEPMTQPLSAVSHDEAPTDDNSEDSLVVVDGMSSNEEAEAVKRRWFRDEMRQSPVFLTWKFIS